jgi:thymidylate kinase
MKIKLLTDATVIYGPDGCGKTTHAVVLAKHFGKSRIVDDWTPGGRLDADTLALTSTPHQGAKPFLVAIREAGIKMSPAAVRRIADVVAITARRAA